MLILSRKAKEQIVIGDNITVIVNWISAGVVSLAIQAPQDVRILRGEVVELDEKRDEEAA